MRRVEVSPLTIRVNGIRGVCGYVVHMLYRPPMEDMWESCTHPAVFKSPERAERLAAKVRRHGPNLTEWILPTEITSPINRQANPGFYSVWAPA